MLIQRNRTRSLAAALIGAGLLFGACATAPHDPDARAVAQRMLHDGDAAGAQTHLAQSADLGDPMTVMLQAEAAFGLGEYEVSVRFYEQLLELPLRSHVRRHVLGNLAAAQRAAGDATTAYLTLQLLAREQGSSPALERRMAACALAAGNLDGARRHLAALPADEHDEIAELLGADFMVATKGN